MTIKIVAYIKLLSTVYLSLSRHTDMIQNQTPENNTKSANLNRLGSKTDDRYKH